MDLNQFANWINGIGDSLEDRAGQVVSAVTLEVTQSLVDTTPVDTSAALSNWQVLVGESDASPIPAYNVGKKGSTREASQASAMSAAKAVVTGSTSLTYTITNPLDYIQKLNDGSSTQAPAGFVETAVLRGVLSAQRNSAIAFNFERS